MGGGSPRKRARCVVLRQVIGHCVYGHTSDTSGCVERPQKSFGVSCRSGGGRVMFRGTWPQGQAGEKGFVSACSRISATCHLGTSSSTLFRDLRLSDDFHVVSSSCFYGSDLLIFLNGVHALQILT